MPALAPPNLADVITVLASWYDPDWAESWDAVGLVCGDPRERVRSIRLAIDAVPATVEEAIGAGAQLLLTHHPLLLTAVHGVPTTDPKGALVHRMIRAGLAHYVVHTNAEVGANGVSDALAAVLGVADTRPIEAAHAPGAVGVGRVGELRETTTLRAFARTVATRLPATAGGVRVSGDLDRPVRRVAMVGGSGSALIDAARAAGADVFVTADLKHHNAVEAVTQRQAGPPGATDDGAPVMALIDTAHWASERPWLEVLARRLRAEFGDTVDVAVSAVVTDPWAQRLPSAPAPPPLVAPTRDEGI